MDKTYAETQGESPFDWNLFLANPPEVHSHEHLRAGKLSESWVTCACGNQCAIIPRAKRHIQSVRLRHAPMDKALHDLGCSFHVAVNGAQWRDARQLLSAIEARSAVLIAAELATRNAQP